MAINDALATQANRRSLKMVPMDFPCPKTWGWTLESSLQPSPNRNYILGVLGAKFVPPCLFFNFFGVQTRFWPTYDYVLWRAFKNRYLGPFKLVPRSSRRSLMSQTFMTLFFNKIPTHPPFFCNLGCQKYFFFKNQGHHFDPQ